MDPSKTNLILPPRMSFLEKQARAAMKERLVLDFLVEGEVYTDVNVAACLIGASVSSSRRTLNRMVKNQILKVESLVINSRHCQIFGISQQGVALHGKSDCRPFELGKTNPGFITHHLKIQMARLSATKIGWTNWISERSIHGKGYLKIPDGLVTDPNGIVVALEVELNVKTSKRYCEIYSAHLQAIAKGHWHEVHYLCPEKLLNGVQRIFAGIDYVIVKGERVQLQQKHRQRFKFFILDTWPNNLKKENL